MSALGDYYALMAEEVMAPVGPILVTADAQRCRLAMTSSTP